VQQGQTTKRIPCLDGLRAIAALGVFFSHSRRTFSAEQYPIFDRFIELWPNANLSVRVFFVISGYLITHLLVRELSASNTISISQFYLRRIVRIFPAFYSYIIAICLVSWATNTYVSQPTLWSAATFTTNYKPIWDTSGPNAGNWLLGHFWTLSLEEQFYLFWPVLLLCSGIKKAAWFAFFMIILMPVSRIFSQRYFPELNSQIGMMLHTAIDSVMTGALLALVTHFSVADRYLRRLRDSSLYAVASLILLFFICPHLKAEFREFEIVLGMTIENISIALILYWLVNNPQRLIPRVLENRLFVHLGVISYSLYLWQQLFFSALFVATPFLFPYNLLTCLLVAELSYTFIEKPFLRYRGRINDNKS
jgi:peptidoglycan/LPS O-acetylase OafA/YrhL